MAKKHSKSNLSDSTWVIRPIEYVNESPMPEKSLFEEDPARRKLAWRSALKQLNAQEDRKIVKARAKAARDILTALNEKFPPQPQ